MLLFDAIRAKDPERVKECLEKARDNALALFELVNTPIGEPSYFPLLWALLKLTSAIAASDKDKLKEIVHLLTAAGASANVVVCGETMLSQAVLVRTNPPQVQFQVVKCLVEEYAAELNNPEAHSLLWLAAIKDRTETFDYLLTKGVRLDLPDISGRTLRERALEWPDSCRMPALVASLRSVVVAPPADARLTGFVCCPSSESVAPER